MIKTKQDLREYIAADRSRYRLRWFDRFISSESYKTMKYLRNLRKVEYHVNNSGIYHRLMWGVRYFIWRRLNWKYGICIYPNTCGKGLFLSHIMGGGIIVVRYSKIGEYCIIGPNCIIGTKKSAQDVPTIGDKVEICMGAKLYGTLHVGDNAVICPNSVVIKDVPAGAIMSGVPAKIIKINA